MNYKISQWIRWNSLSFVKEANFKWPKWINFFFSNSKKGNTNNKKSSIGGSSDEKPTKIRWRRIFYAFLTIGAISTIAYFVFGFNQPKYIEAKGFYVSKNGSGSSNEPKIVIVDNDAGYYVIDPKKTNFYSLRSNVEAFDVFHVQTYDLIRNQKIEFKVKLHESGDTIRFNIGGNDIERIRSKKTSSGTSGSDTYEYNYKYNEGNSLSENSTYKKEANIGNDLLKPVFSYFSQASFNTKTYVPFNFGNFIIGLLPIILFTSLFIFGMRASMKAQAGQDGIFGVGKTTAKKIKTNVNFKDVAGIEEEKQELIEIVDYLKNPQKYASMGARAPKGLILYGPPGTGKTLLAKAVSGEANVPFFEASGSSFDDMFVGVGAKRVRNLFAQAKKNAPCIIFIDEIDAVAGKRGSRNVVGGGGGYADQTINQLLSEMDGFNTAKGIVVMAATNRLDSLDDAILRPGRFDRQIQINLPDIRERTEILKIHAQNKNISSRVALEDVARRTPGFSGAQLENVLNEATILAVRHNKNVISTEEVDEAIDRVMAGPAKKSRSATEQDLKITAYHEAGHALVGLYVDGGELVEKITIIPRGKAAGYTLYAPSKQESMMRTKKELLSSVTTALAGRAAEELIFGIDNITTGAVNDFYKATNIVRSMVTQLGMSKLGLTQFHPSEGQVNPYIKPYSDLTSKLIDQEINDILEIQYDQAKQIILDHRDELDLLAECLLLLEVIVKQQIDYIHKNKKLPPEALEAKAKLQKTNKS